jgi:hypothetical protein
MKKVLLMFLFLFSGMTLFAQYNFENISMNYGQEIPDPKNKIVKIIGESNGKIYTLAVKGDDFTIKIFSSDEMKFVSENIIVIPEVKDREVDFEEIYLLNGKLYVIGSVYDKKEKIFRLVGTEVSEKGILSKDNIILFQAEVAKKVLRGDFYYKVSPDNGALLIMHTSYFPKDESVKYEIKFFDDALGELFSYSEKVLFDNNKKDYQFLIADFEVNYQDDVFLIINESYRDSKKKEKNERFELHAFKRANNYKKEVINIALKDKEIINCSGFSTNNNTLHLVGFYSSVRESGRPNKELKGVYSVAINTTTNVADKINFNEFDHATKVKILGERKANKGKDLKPMYAIKTLIEKKDGGVIILSEYSLVIYGETSGVSAFGVGVGFTPITYVKNEVIITSLKPDGSLEWSNVVPKDQKAATTTMSVGLSGAASSNGFSVGIAIDIPVAQMGKGPEYLGYIPIYKDDKLNIIFNDNVSNKGVTDMDKIKSLGNYNNALPTLFVYDEKGNATRKDPSEAKDNELVIRPGVYYRKSDNEIIIYASRKKQNKLGRLFIK